MKIGKVGRHDQPLVRRVNFFDRVGKRPVSSHTAYTYNTMSPITSSGLNSTALFESRNQLRMTASATERPVTLLVMDIINLFDFLIVPTFADRPSPKHSPSIFPE